VARCLVKKKRVVTALALAHSLDISPASYIQIELVLMCEQQKIPAAASWVGVNHARRAHGLSFVFSLCVAASIMSCPRYFFFFSSEKCFILGLYQEYI
jgi:hypothetical protein